MADIFNMLDTWNAGATVFTGIKLSVTDTASAAGSLLMDLQVGGVSKFRVDKSGFIRVDGGSVGDAAIKIGNPNTGFFGINTSSFGLVAGNVEVARFLDAGELRLPSAVFLSWNADTRLYRDGAANTLAQRNGVNAQAFNLYNTYTDASNYERGVMKWASNVLSIGTEAAGTGSTRIARIVAGGVARAEFGPNYNDYLLGSGTRFYSGTLGGGTNIISFVHEFSGGGFAGGIKFTATSFGWSAGQPTGADSGLIRTAAAKLKVTDGSTGTGQLIFIVPTTDPGITGALWNNLGVLSISA